jgi:hypothetical protein
MKALHLKFPPRPFMELPPKANGRLGFHESAILLLRQGMVAGTTLPLFPAPPACPASPYWRPSKTTDTGTRSENKLYLYSSPVKGVGGKNIPINFPRPPLTFIERLISFATAIAWQNENLEKDFKLKSLAGFSPGSLFLKKILLNSTPVPPILQLISLPKPDK